MGKIAEEKDKASEYIMRCLLFNNLYTPESAIAVKVHEALDKLSFSDLDYLRSLVRGNREITNIESDFMKEENDETSNETKNS